MRTRGTTAKAQQTAAPKGCWVKICTMCSSIRGRINGCKANKSTGGTVRYNTTCTTVLTPICKKTTLASGLRVLGVNEVCANCGTAGGIVEMPAIGWWFRSVSSRRCPFPGAALTRVHRISSTFLRHVDRQAVSCTVCCGCGKLSNIEGIVGELPFCSTCYRNKMNVKPHTVCAGCRAKIHPTALRLEQSVRAKYGFVRTPKAANLCIRCSRVTDPQQEWNPHQQQTML